MILRSLAVQLGATIYVGIVSFALSVFIARQTGPANFGEYSVALSIGAVLAIFIDGGMRSLLMRERTLLTNSHLARLSHLLPSIAFGHALIVALVSSLIAITFFRDQMALALATVWCFFGIVVTQYISAMLRGEGRLALDAGWQIGHRTLSAVFIVLAIILGLHSPWHILAAWALGALTANLLFPFGLKCRPSFTFRPGLYNVALPLLWIDLATTIYFRSDIMMLHWFGVPLEKIGQYTAGYRLIEAVILLATPVGILLFRHIRLLNKDRHRLSQHIPRATALAAILGVSGALIITVLAEPVVTLTYGSKYPEAAGLLAILTWSLLFILPNAVLTQAALALNLERPYVWAASIAAVCNVVLNFVFILRYGLQAAAWVTIVTEAVLFAILAFVLHRNLKRPLTRGLLGRHS
jgi:O-antigen/teichoic acid export membrane protein